MKKVLLGNEAIVKGALEAGVQFVSGYPGCPSAEIGQEFLNIAKNSGIYAEWSINEKTALEAAIGASFSGKKSLVNMKSFGINVCSDSLLPLAYTGIKAGMVIVVADDPNGWSSAQSEQDSRGYAHLSHIPMIEPSDPQECYEFTKLAFEISEKFSLPVILHTTTRTNHQKAIVDFKEVVLKTFDLGEFEKKPKQYCTMPPRVLEMKKELFLKIEKLRQFAEKSKANILEKGKGKMGIITSGVSYLHTKEVLRGFKLDLPVLKLGFFYPLPENKIADFAKGLKEVLVIEEIEGYIEKEIKAILKNADIKTKVRGKDILPKIGEMDAEKITAGISKFLNLKIKKAQIKEVALSKRTARLCEGCPYWYILPTIKKVAPQNTVFGGDIGCNMIAGLAPHNMHDYLFSMGASLGIGHGVAKSVKPEQKVIALMGDGTFFHAGIQALANAVYNKSNPLLVVFDNRITAMTGHQQNPGIGKTGTGQDTEEVKIEEVAKSLGVKHIKVLDPINSKEFEDALNNFIKQDKVSLIVCRRIRALLEGRIKKNG